MRRAIQHAVEDILRDYPKFPQYIKEREQELLHPTPDPDDNVGGGRAENKRKDPTGRSAITIADDGMLLALKKEYKAIDDCLDDSGEITTKIIQELYFKSHTGKRIVDLCEQHIIPVSTTKAYDLRNQFLEKLAKKLHLDVL